MIILLKQLYQYYLFKDNILHLQKIQYEYWINKDYSRNFSTCSIITLED